MCARWTKKCQCYIVRVSYKLQMQREFCLLSRHSLLTNISGPYQAWFKAIWHGHQTAFHDNLTYSHIPTHWKLLWQQPLTLWREAYSRLTVNLTTGMWNLVNFLLHSHWVALILVFHRDKESWNFTFRLQYTYRTRWLWMKSTGIFAWLGLWQTTEH